MKILLIQPPKTDNSMSMIDMSLTEPLALEILASCLSEYEVKLLDMRLEDDLETTLNDFKPDIVGTTAFTAEVYKASKVLESVKKFDQDILTIIGGHHATLMPQDFDKKYIDIVAIGEGEHIIKEIVEAKSKKTGYENIKGIAIRTGSGLKFTKPRTGILDLDSLQFADRQISARYRDKYFRGTWKPAAAIYSSRGCPFRCDFCAMWKVFKGKFRIRTAAKLVDELETINEKFINFSDDNTIQNVKYAEEIYSEIKSRNIKKTYKLYGRSDTIVKHPDIIEKWKSIGMELLLIGLEAFKDSDLKARNKNNTIKNNEEAIKILHKNKVEVVAYFLVDQNFTKEDFRDLSLYVEGMNLSHPVFTVLTPFPGTDLYEKRFKDLTTNNYEMFDIFHSVLPTRMPLPEFYENFINLYRKAYLKKGNNFLSEDMVNAMVKKFIDVHHL